MKKNLVLILFSLTLTVCGGTLKSNLTASQKEARAINLNQVINSENESLSKRRASFFMLAITDQEIKTFNDLLNIEKSAFQRFPDKNTKYYLSFDICAKRFFTENDEQIKSEAFNFIKTNPNQVRYPNLKMLSLVNSTSCTYLTDAEKLNYLKVLLFDVEPIKQSTNEVYNGIKLYVDLANKTSVPKADAKEFLEKLNRKYSVLLLKNKDVWEKDVALIRLLLETY